MNDDQPAAASPDANGSDASAATPDVQPASPPDPRRLRVRLRVRPRLGARGRIPGIGPRRSTPAPRIAGSLLRLSLALAVGYAALAGGLLYWQVMQARALTTDPLNPIVLAAARDAPRGTIYDSSGKVLADNLPGATRQREYPYVVAAPVVGYRSNIFGTAGLENAFDAQLTGLGSLNEGDDLLRKFRAQSYDPADLHTSLDIDLQQAAADLRRMGATVLLTRDVTTPFGPCITERAAIGNRAHAQVAVSNTRGRGTGKRGRISRDRPRAGELEGREQLAHRCSLPPPRPRSSRSLPKRHRLSRSPTTSVRTA